MAKQKTQENTDVLYVKLDDVRDLFSNSIDTIKEYLVSEIGNKMTKYSAQGFLGEFVQGVNNDLNSLLTRTFQEDST